MNCEMCSREVRGDVEVSDAEIGSEAWAAFVSSAPDRDFIICEGCNKVVCCDCCQRPRTGYCDACLESYLLDSEVAFVERCDIDELPEFLARKQERGRRGRFMKTEAESKIGKRVRSLVEFAGVPKGTTGRVVRADDMNDGWDAVIEWDIAMPPPSVMVGEIAGAPVTIVTTGDPLQDWFTKDEYEKYLEEI